MLRNTVFKFDLQHYCVFRLQWALHKASHPKLMAVITILCFLRSRIITKLLFCSNSCSLWEMWHSGNNEYYIERWQMLSPYGLVRNYCNSFMNVRSIRGSSGYFQSKNSVGMKELKTSEIFLISLANLVQHKLCFFVLHVLNCLEELFWEL